MLTPLSTAVAAAARVAVRRLIKRTLVMFRFCIAVSTFASLRQRALFWDRRFSARVSRGCAQQLDLRPVTGGGRRERVSPCRSTKWVVAVTDQKVLRGAVLPGWDIKTN